MTHSSKNLFREGPLAAKYIMGPARIMTYWEKFKRTGSSLFWEGPKIGPG